MQSSLVPAGTLAYLDNINSPQIYIHRGNIRIIPIPNLSTSAYNSLEFLKSDGTHMPPERIKGLHASSPLRDYKPEEDGGQYRLCWNLEDDYPRVCNRDTVHTEAGLDRDMLNGFGWRPVWDPTNGRDYVVTDGRVTRGEEDLNDILAPQRQEDGSLMVGFWDRGLGPGAGLSGAKKEMSWRGQLNFDFVDASTPDDPGIALMDLTPNIAEKYMGIPGGNDLKQFYVCAHPIRGLTLYLSNPYVSTAAKSPRFLKEWTKIPCQVVRLELEWWSETSREREYPEESPSNIPDDHLDIVTDTFEKVRINFIDRWGNPERRYSTAYLKSIADQERREAERRGGDELPVEQSEKERWENRQRVDVGVGGREVMGTLGSFPTPLTGGNRVPVDRGGAYFDTVGIEEPDRRALGLDDLSGNWGTSEEEKVESPGRRAPGNFENILAGIEDDDHQIRVESGPRRRPGLPRGLFVNTNLDRDGRPKAQEPSVASIIHQDTPQELRRNDIVRSGASGFKRMGNLAPLATGDPEYDLIPPPAARNREGANRREEPQEERKEMENNPQSTSGLAQRLSASIPMNPTLLEDLRQTQEDQRGEMMRNLMQQGHVGAIRDYHRALLRAYNQESPTTIVPEVREREAQDVLKEARIRDVALRLSAGQPWQREAWDNALRAVGTPEMFSADREIERRDSDESAYFGNAMESIFRPPDRSEISDSSVDPPLPSRNWRIRENTSGPDSSMRVNQGRMGQHTTSFSPIGRVFSSGGPSQTASALGAGQVSRLPTMASGREGQGTCVRFFGKLCGGFWKALSQGTQPNPGDVVIDPTWV